MSNTEVVKRESRLPADRKNIEPEIALNKAMSSVARSNMRNADTDEDIARWGSEALGAQRRIAHLKALDGAFWANPVLDGEVVDGRGGDRGNQYTGGKTAIDGRFATLEDLYKEASISRSEARRRIALHELHEAGRMDEAFDQAQADENWDYTVTKLYTQEVSGPGKREQIEREMRARQEAAPVKPKVVQAAAGDLIDSMEQAAERVEVLLTDPPYASEFEDGSYRAFLDTWLPRALDRTLNRAYIFAGAYPKEMYAYLNVFNGLDGWIVDHPLIWSYRNTLGPQMKHKYLRSYQLIWHLRRKDAPALNFNITREMFSVHEFSAPGYGPGGVRYHSWQKPEELIEMLIAHSTREGDRILDPFTGSGTIPLAASRLGRQCVASDLDLSAYHKRFDHA